MDTVRTDIEDAVRDCGHLPITTALGELEVQVVGKRPENEPYIWFGLNGLMVDTVSESEMRLLARQIRKALGQKP